MEGDKDMMSLSFLLENNSKQQSFVISLQGQVLFFGQKYDKETAGWTECTSSHIHLLCYFLKTEPATTFLLFGLVTLLCGLKCGESYLMTEGSA